MQPIAAQTSKEISGQRSKGARECQQQHLRRQSKKIEIQIEEKNHQKINKEIFFFRFLLFVVLFVVLLLLLFVVVLLLFAVASGAAGESVV